MDTSDLLSFLARFFFLLLGLVTTINYLRYQGETRRDIALMSGSLATPFLIQIFTRTTGVQSEWLDVLGSVALLTQPYLLLRLAQYFYAIPPLIMRLALASMILAEIVFVLFERFSSAPSVIVLLAIIAYFVAVDGYAMVIFIRGALTTSGVVQQRLRLAAAGSGLLALALAVAGLTAVFPALQDSLISLALLAAIVAAASYYVGFVPPRWLQRAWQFTELQNYMLGIRSKRIDKHLNVIGSLEELCQVANLAIGGETAAIAQEDESGKRWLLCTVTERPELSNSNLSGEGILGRVQQNWTPAYIRASGHLDQGDRHLLEMMNADTLLAAPIRAAEHDWGLLLVFLKRGSLFIEDDLNLLTLLAQQSAIFLENWALIEEMHRYSESLEQEVEERTSEIRQLNLQLERRVAERTADLSRANAELGRVVRAKDEFLANMSHELRTPLNGILILAEVLLEQIRGPLNQRQSSSIQTIQESGHHLLSLINDILDLSKIEAGKLEMQIETLSIKGICETSLQFVKELAHKKQIRLSFEGSDLPHRMEAEPRRLKQILINLLNNAVKFTPDGGQVTLTMLADEAQNLIRFVVEDNGIGISAENMTRLFQPFSQLDGGLTREHEGTGLGLALVSRLVELHGGSVAVESEGVPGKGSRFTVFLPWRHLPSPADQADVEAALANLEQALLRLSSHGNQIVNSLVVEDSPTAAEQIDRYLKELGVQVVAHSPGEHALENALMTSPDLIILDLLMPDRSGWEVLAQLKADPRIQTVPVIIISVVDEPVRGLAAGAVEYLVKPITREQFRQALARVVVSLEPAESDHPHPTPPPASPEPQGPLILLAEDNETNIQAIGEYLQDVGYRLVVARNGGEALDLAWEWKPELILMDIQMPVLDGFTVTQRLRAMSEFDATPIIALTALAMPGDRERCLAAGANEYLAKPVRLKNLMEIINQHLPQG
jgi:signal transduction histidine kinase/DNA-binding response OmpR family regulator